MITDKQLAARRNWLGASDLPALMGLVPWKSGEEVRLEKLGRLDPAPTSEAAEIGIMHERAVLDWAEGWLGTLRRNPNNVKRTCLDIRMRASLDAVAVGDGGNPVEAKTAGIVNPFFRGEEWGEDGTDEVPENVMIQAQGQLLCTSKPVCHVAALVAGRGHLLYHVQRNDELIELIRRVAFMFWRHVKNDWPWAHGIVSADVYKRIRRVPKSIVKIPADVISAWEAAKAITKQAKEAEEAAKAEVLRHMGVAEAGDFGEWGRFVTYFERTRKAHSVRESRFRMLDITRGNLLDYTPINVPQLTQGEPEDVREADDNGDHAEQAGA